MMRSLFRRRRKKKPATERPADRRRRPVDPELEVEMLRLAWEEDLTAGQIGEVLGLTASGVRTCLSRLYGRLGVHSRVEAINEAITRGLLKPVEVQPGAGTVALEDDEVAILEMVKQGKSSVEIGEALGIAEKTVRNRLSRIHRKLGVRSRLAAARRAVELGLIEPLGKGQ